MESFFIVGYKGSQKNIIGQMLSARLSCELIDVTKIVEDNEKQELNDIIDSRGSDYFERITEYNIKNIPHKDNVVLIGDTNISDDEFIREMKKYGRFIYLKAEPETLYKNIIENDEKILGNNNEITIDIVRDNLEKNKKFYEKVANTTINIDNKKITNIFKEVLGYYNMITKLICHIFIK